MEIESWSDDEMFRLLYPSLRRFAAVVGSRSDDPDDLVQEALARTLARGDLADIDNPGAYLTRVISNLAINGARAEATRTRNMAVGFVDPTGCDWYPSDLDVLQRLTPIERAVVYLVDIECRPFAEAATMVGISTVAARLRASRARRLLRKILEQDQ